MSAVNNTALPLFKVITASHPEGIHFPNDIMDVVWRHLDHYFTLLAFRVTHRRCIPLVEKHIVQFVKKIGYHVQDFKGAQLMFKRFCDGIRPDLQILRDVEVRLTEADIDNFLHEMRRMTTEQMFNIYDTTLRDENFRREWAQRYGVQERIIGGFGRCVQFGTVRTNSEYPGVQLQRCCYLLTEEGIYPKPAPKSDLSKRIQESFEYFLNDVSNFPVRARFFLRLMTPTQDQMKTLMEEAVRQDNNSLVHEMIKLGLENGREEALVSCCKYGDQKYELAFELVKKGANVNYINKEGWTPLSYLYSIAEMRMAILLIRAGADIHHIDRKQSYLHWAILHDNYNLACLLLENGAKLDVINDKGETPLGYAERLGRQNIVELIQEREKKRKRE